MVNGQSTLLAAACWLLLAAFCLLMLVGCSNQMRVRFLPRPSQTRMMTEVERLGKTAVYSPGSAPISKGSLWPADDHAFFYGDRKALREGDILTISVVENATASNKADTTLTRDSSLKATVTEFFAMQNFAGTTPLSRDIIDATTKNAHTGTGTTTRAGVLTASMTVVVRQVLANGNLVVQGSRTLVVNHEEQFMTLTGIVRPQDVSRDNVVLSTQVADARIAFGGVGVVADKQRSSWFTWIFDLIWLF